MTTQPLNNTDGWSPVVPLTPEAPAPFPTHALPETLRDLVSAVSDSLQVPPELPAYLVLAALGTMCGGKLWVQPKDGWCEPTNIWTCVAMPPGSRKSPTFRIITKPLYQVERDLADRTAPERSAAAMKRGIAEARAKNFETQAAKEMGDDRMVLEDQAVQARIDADAIRVPAEPRLLAADVTPERLQGLLKEQNGHLGMMVDEGGPLNMMGGQYSSKPNLDVYLQSWGGDAVSNDRVSRESTRIESACLSLGLAVQPQLLKDSSTSVMHGRGLMARFWYAVPKNLVGDRDTDTGAVPADVTGAWAELIASLSLLPECKSEDERPTITLDADAHAAVRAWLKTHESRMRSETGDLAVIADWASKHAGNMLRVAALLHASIHPFQPHLTPMTLETVSGAMELAEHAVDHALVGYAMMSSRRDIAPAQSLLSWVSKKRLGVFSIRDAWDGMHSRNLFESADDIADACTVLVEHGYLRPAPPQVRNPGRPPSQRFEVHPVVFTDSKRQPTTGMFPSPDSFRTDSFRTSTVVPLHSGLRATTLTERQPQ